MKNLLTFLFVIVQLLNAYQFGKNKVIYRKSDWKILKTAHFNYYYHSSLKEVALKAAKIAEEASADLSRVYRHELNGIIPVIIYPSTIEFANNTIIPQILGESTGGFTEVVRSRVVIPFNGKYEDFRHVLVHELNHAFQFNILYKGAQGFSFGKMASKQPPLWVMEGLAEFYSRGMDSESEKYSRQAVISGFFPSLMELSDLYSLGYKGYYVYKGGQSFFAWLQDKYGSSEMAAELYYRFTAEEDSGKVFPQVFGKDMKTINRQWMYDLKKKYWKDLKKYRNPEEEGIRLTHHFHDKSSYNIEPVFGHHKHILYFLTDRHVYPKIVRYNTSQKKITDVIAEADKSVYLESINTLNNTLSVNSNGTSLLFSSRTGNHYFLNIYNTFEKEIAEKTPLPFDMVYGSSLSPDGKQACLSAVLSNQIDLYIVDIPSGRYFPITDDKYTEDSPSWSPDGRYIAWSGNRHYTEYSFKRTLFLYDTQQKEHNILSIIGDKNYAPSWSPDSKKVAFTSSRDGADNIYIKDLETYVVKQMTAVAGSAEDSSWSPDGQMIVYSCFSDNGYDLFLKKTDPDNPEKNRDGTIEKPDKLVPEKKKDYITSLISKTPLKYGAYLTPSITEKHQGYKPALNPEYFMFSMAGSSSLGFGGNALASFSDMLNEHRLQASVFLNYWSEMDLLDNDSYAVYINMEQRLNYVIQAYFYQYNNFYKKSGVSVASNISEDYEGFTDKQIGAGGGILYPFNKYTRFETVIIPMYIGRVHHPDLENEELINEYPEFHKFSLNTEISFTYDSTLMGMLHPLDNQLVKISVKGSPPLGNTMSFLRLYGDLRNYFMITPKMSIAGRIMSGAVWGADRDKYIFKIGGEAIHHNFPNIRAHDFYSLQGSYMWLINLEFRTQILKHASFSFPFPFSISRINGVFFLDAGSAFSDSEKYLWARKTKKGYKFQDIKASMGLGLRFVLLYFPMKLDFSVPIEGFGYGIDAMREWKTFLSIGFDF